MSDTVARLRIAGTARGRQLPLGLLCVTILAMARGLALSPGAEAATTLSTRAAVVASTSEQVVEDAATPPTESPPPQSPPTAPTPSSRRLSNERTLTTWAHPVGQGQIRTLPQSHAPRAGQVHLETEEGFPEVYLLLSSQTDAQGNEWVKLRIPGRPNGRTGWVSRELLGAFHRTRWLIVIDLRQRRLRAYFDGHLRRVAPVGVGKPSTPTPPGHFWIRERFRVTDHSSPYWPYALGTSDYSTLSEWPGGGVVGIHGPFGEPQAIPGDPSHGCVRMRAADIAWLGPQVTLGTPVNIVTG